jgi:hypothetical protein
MYCHNCGKPNPAGSHYCHDCGTGFTEPSSAEKADTGAIGRGGFGLQWPQVSALFGGVLLFLGVFAPAFRVTVVFFSVTFDFFNGGHGDGKYLMGLAILALIVAGFKRYWGVFAVGIISLAIIVVDLVDAMNKWGANSLVALSYEWGCAVLILGAVLLLAVPLIASMTAQNDPEFNLYADEFA